MAPEPGTAIVGLGITPMGKIYGRTAADFAADAVALALEDAGLEAAELDGLLVTTNFAPDMTPLLQFHLGLRDMSVVAAMSAFGSTAGAMLQYASALIASGAAKTIVLLYADAPLVPGTSAGDAYSRRSETPTGFPGLAQAYGAYSVNLGYAQAARRHMHLFGTTSEQLGAIAVGQRAWAQHNPVAQMRGRELTLEDHQRSRWVVEPLRLFDCCLVSNGAVAVIVTGCAHAADLRQPPVYVRGVAQAAPGDRRTADHDPAIHTGAATSGPRALRMAGIELADVDVLELYDCYTYTVLVTLEDLGYCAKGEGGAFVQDGRLGPGGSLPTNTGGGQLSSFYMWGMTPLSEGIIQARGQGGGRQAERHDHVLVSGNGGTLNFHSTAILSPHPG